ncbi:F-box protein At3g49510 [Arabidopsis lyrata subsp. lyrata]|uniref:F-box protein At3g49510 n=1 Tax=Arabidopsis lyrata subsp. lyrata TaxID=81972 RepID=UPI000A29E02E|nr:F-box protein At3g49510 [Arabidopsis lyrata subsp. lyrata]|eukprot:XP_020879678.1 F-box protein At3g49510 [Arabidopsis lyrata subsp. lyrata]
MTTISDLSEDLVGEILSWVPFTSLTAVRSTCKKWNALSKNHIFGRKTASRNQFLEFMVADSRVCSLRLDLQGIRNDDVEDYVDSSMKQITIPNNDDQVEISQVYHCDGLLLCIAKDNSRLFVWNPYLGQTKWIQPRNKFHKYDRFALGYDNNRNHKILRFLYDEENNESCRRTHIDVYDFSSDSWRVLDVNPDCDIIPFYLSGVSLKGNTYFFGQEVTQASKVTNIETCLLCFDFTTERFGPRLPLLFHPPCPSFETVTLSWVRDEKLAVLYNHYVTSEILELRISTKIEPNAVLWSSFLTVDMSVVNGLPDDFSMYFEAKSFFIDEEKKVVVLFDSKVIETCRYQMAYIVGDDGYFKSVNIGVISNSQRKPGKLVCSSYVPSLVQLQD